jgi:hypothetical protein
MKMQHEYAEIFIKNGGPREALLLAHSDSQEFYDYYFSPEAARIAIALVLAHDGVPCSKPRRKDVRLAVGDVNSLNRMLPEEGNS